jgi:23S rRNA G2445 N2-methylase RlmL
VALEKEKNLCIGMKETYEALKECYGQISEFTTCHTDCADYERELPGQHHLISNPPYGQRLQRGDLGQCLASLMKTLQVQELDLFVPPTFSLKNFTYRKKLLRTKHGGGETQLTRLALKKPASVR